MKKLKTGTTIVGIVVKDGVVIASDKRATASNVIASRGAEKIIPVTDNVVIAAAGMVADMQFLARVIRAESRLKELRGKRKVTAKEIAHLLSVLLYSKRFYFMPYFVSLLVGGADGNGSFGLYTLDAYGSIVQEKKYYAEGSGMMFALGVLESQYREDMSLEEAEKLAENAIRVAISRDIGSGDGIEMVTISKDGIKRKLIKFKQVVEEAK